VVVGDLHVELIGGPLDGAEIIVPDVCDCCGKEVAPGSVFAEKGLRYVLGRNRCYAFFLDEVAQVG
jgi:hypothetical protein